MTYATLLILYLCFRLKHFLCDFILQSDWMALSKGEAGPNGYKALFSHTAVHALGTGIILLIFAPGLWWLIPVDFVIHATIDRVKGIMTRKWQLAPKDKYFWWAYGLDQELHHLTHVGFIVVIALHAGI